MDALVLDGGPLCISDVERVAAGGGRISVGDNARRLLERSREVVGRVAQDGRAHYGINTGFGSLSRHRIPDQHLRDLQRNLIRSHSAGAGDPLPDVTVRGTMLVLAASLCRGFSGVRPIVVDRLVALLNGGVTPLVPSLGSVGASGDLAPLAHIALVLMGEGRARAAAGAMEAIAALASIGCEPLVLEAKEGLALVNGTHLMACEGALVCADLDRVFGAALVACAMSMDAARATDAFLDDRAYVVRNQPGPRKVARVLRAHLDGSQVVLSHRTNDPRVQDPYSFRCAAYVLGAADDAVTYARQCIDAELGAVTDNPIVFPDGDVLSAGNFHGMPVAVPLDVLAIAAAHIAGIAQQRIHYMLSARDPETDLMPYLSPQPGLCSGLMVTQYTAAACCNELAGLAAPASVVNLPTSGGMEDYNSFGPRSAAKARRAVELARHVIAIELLCAAQGIEYHRPLRSGEAVERAHARIREVVPPLSDDRPPAPDIAAIANLISSGALAT